MSDELLRCRSCRARTSLTAGTIFEGTRKALRTWSMAMWFVTSQKNGVSALGLRRVLGLGSYETAGLGCTSCAGQWCGPDGTFCLGQCRHRPRPLSHDHRKTHGSQRFPEPGSVKGIPI